MSRKTTQPLSLCCPECAAPFGGAGPSLPGPRYRIRAACLVAPDLFSWIRLAGINYSKEAAKPPLRAILISSSVWLVTCISFTL